jgi:NADPH-dependent curcumin reductase
MSDTSPLTNKQWRIAAHPQGMVQESDFAWSEEPLAPLADGEIRVRTLYLSMSPSDRILAGALPTGQVMLSEGLGAVLESRRPDFQVGEIIYGVLGWQEYQTADGSGWTRPFVHPGLPWSDYLALYGITGPTAYVGLLDLGQPQPGETLVVSAAAGSVGSLAGQIGKIRGCRVIGIAGSDEKCRWITDTLGFDGALNYKSGPLAERLRALCPAGIDIYFDNVGGDTLDAVLGQINPHARVIICGMISQYNTVLSGPIPGPANFFSVLAQRARVEGFLIWDHLERFPQAAADLQRWHAEGKLQYRTEQLTGLENAPSGLRKLFQGDHQGKLILQVSAEQP